MIWRSQVVNSICTSSELPFYPFFQLIFFDKQKAVQHEEQKKETHNKQFERKKIEKLKGE